MKASILLGFEIGTGAPVYMKQAHTVALGMTQHGKTATLEAVISRNTGSKALAFKTKRGEAGFNRYHNIQPFYKSRADWQYVESLLNVALREKVQYQPFMRWAILQVTKGHPETLRQIMERAHELQTKYSRRKEVFETLEAYLQLVVPELESHTFSHELKLQEGINVMDISDLQTETQYLVIAASIEEVFLKEKNITVIIPEAWESIPQSRATPVKLVAERFIRKGAAIGDFLYIDSQDIGGIDKTPLRQCDNWIMGRMKEAHEVERLRDQVHGLKVTAEDFQTLPLGTFYAVLGNVVKKVYVLPAGVPEQMGIDVATGKISPEKVKSYLELHKTKTGDDEEMYKELYEKEQQKTRDLEKKMGELHKLELTEEQRKMLIDYPKMQLKLEELEKRNKTQESTIKALDGELAVLKPFGDFIENLKKTMFPDGAPAMQPTQAQGQDISLEAQSTEITVQNLQPKQISLTTDKPAGQILYCALNLTKRLGTPFTSAMLQSEAQENGWNINSRKLGGTLLYMIREGILIKDGDNYRLPTQIKISAEKPE